MALLSRSPVRIRITESMVLMKILPSPISPVRAASWIAGANEIRRVTGFFERYGLWAIAFSRWLPAIPELLACLAGLTRMSFARFTIGNSTGSLAVGFAYAYFGSRGEDNPGAALAAAAILPYLALPLFFALFARKGRSARAE